MVFDLDPAGDDFPAVREAAVLLGGLLDELKLPSALMTTGSRGLHVVVPLNGRHGFDKVREFARDVADVLAAGHPDRLTTAARKKTAATGSTSTSSATPTRRPRSPPTPSGRCPARPSPPRCPGTSSTIPRCTRAAGRSRTPPTRRVPAPGPRSPGARGAWAPPGGGWTPCAAERNLGSTGESVEVWRTLLRPHGGEVAMSNTNNTSESQGSQQSSRKSQKSQDSQESRKTHNSHEAQESRRPRPMEVLREARAQLAELTGMTAESVSSFEQTEEAGRWRSRCSSWSASPTR